MIAIILIALAAGAASALMFASMVSGALISVLLLYLAPLPLMVAALGWGPLCATIGGIAAATGLGVIFGLPYCIAFAVAVALPAWWLGHLALLGRPIANSETSPENGVTATPPLLEWYPVGRSGVTTKPSTKKHNAASTCWRRSRRLLPRSSP